MRFTCQSRWALFFLVIGVTTVPGLAGVQVNKMFSDHMVLQRDLPVPFWGTADPGERVTVTFRDQTKQVTADKDGAWLARLDPLKVGEPGTLTVAGNDKVTFSDVLVGEVWIGSGQSNMAGGAGGYAKRDEVLAAMIKAGPYPKLRLYRGSWSEATPESIGRFSAIHFSFGQPLQEELEVPVGLIVGAVGGTPSGRWLSPQMFADDPGVLALRQARGAGSFEAQQQQYQEALAKWTEAAKVAKSKKERAPRRPANPFPTGDLYARHIQPVIPYAIRGVLWDQGESGTAVKDIDQFTMMGALIKGWRKAWGQGAFPFLYVQKPSGGGCAWDPTNDKVTRMANPFSAQPAAPNKDEDGLYRELHVRIMQHPNTAMVQSSDLGSGVHPVNKSGYGRRACRVALGFVYGRKVEYYGPKYASHDVNGGEIHVHYTHTDKGLAQRHGDKLQGFEIAGSDGVYHWADARIDGDTVVASSPDVAAPVNVRYGWSRKNRTWANLFNKDGLPALTFRTDTATPRLGWKQNRTSVALLNHGKVVWQHVHDKKIGKPYMRFGLLDGSELTRPWPIPAGYPKNDHTWHRALWWSWKGINGINFWEEHQQGTEPGEVKTMLSPDGSAEIAMDLSYHLPDQPPLAREKRVITVTAPDKKGNYLITWRATFTPGGSEDVVFNRNGYGGFALRMAGEFGGDPEKVATAWRFTKSTEPADRPKRGSRWVAYAGNAQNGKPVCIAMFDHPDNPRYPTQWALRTNYPYMNPAFTADKQDYTLQAGESLTLTYGLLVHNGVADIKALESAWQRFAQPAKN